MANSGLLIPEVLPRLPGTINEGGKYEHHLAALFAVRTALSDDIEDMWMATNVAGLGKFDDLVLFLRKRSAQHSDHEMYLIQSRYKKNRNLNLSSGDNSLQKFQESYLKIKQDFSNGNSPLGGTSEFTKIKFLLFTRHQFSLQSTDMQECNIPSDVVNTGKIFRIRNSTDVYDQDFLNQTLFYSNQIEILHIENLIRKETEKFFKNCDTKKLLNFFDLWHDAGFEDSSVLKKENIISILLEASLSSYIPKPSFKTFPKADIWNEVTKHFKLVSVKQETHLPYIWSAVQLQMNNILRSGDIDLLQWKEILQTPSNIVNKVKPHFLHKWYPVKRKKNSFTIEDLYIMLWQECSLPLVLSLDDNSSQNVFKVLSKLESTNSKRRYICFESVAREFPEHFTNFKSLNIDKFISQKALKNIYVSLQGKRSVTLEELKPSEAALQKITPDMFIELLQNDIKKDVVDPSYVPRFLKQPVVSMQVLTLENAVFVIVTDHKFYKSYKKLFTFGRTLPWYFYKLCGNQFSHSLKIKEQDSVCIIVKRGIDYFKKYREIEDVIKHVRGSQNQTVHFLKLLNNNELGWLYSNRNADQLKPFLLSSNSAQYLPDKKLFDYLTFNILSANAGEGKSTLLQFLAKRCPADIWVITLNIGEIAKYIAKGDFSTIMKFLYDHSKDSFLPYEEFSWELFQTLFQELKILVVIDGLDEGEFNANTISFLNEIKAFGIKTIIATRPSLKDTLERVFETSSLLLKLLTSEECQLLIQRSLLNSCDMLEINKVIQKLSDWDNVVGIPLMLKFIVSLLNSGRQLDFDRFDITDLFETYINGQLNKVGKFNKSTQRTLSRSALLVFYKEEVISQLFRINELFEDLEDKIDSYKESKLIEKLSSDGVPIFAHKSLAEFLAAQVISDLVTSFEHKSLTVIQDITRSLFYQELEPVRLFFDIMTLKNSTLQRIITDDRREHSGDEFKANLVDKFKRNGLHIAASYGNRCELRNTQSIWSGVKIYESYNNILPDNIIQPGREFKRRPVVPVELFRKILEKRLNPHQEDDLFKLDAFNFALQSGSLDMIEVLYRENFKKEPKDINEDVLLYQAVKNGYVNIYKLLKNKNFALKISPFMDNLLHIALLGENFAMVSELTKEIVNIDEPNINGHTPLISWLSSSRVIDSNNYLDKSGTKRPRFNENQLKILQHLIEREVNVNKANAIGETPLHVFSKSEEVSIVKILISNGAEVNKKTDEGNTPLHYAAQYSLDTVKILEEHTTEIDTSNNLGYTPLCFAARNNLLDIVEFLISKGAVINRSNNEVNPLNCAIIRGNMECAELLINKSATINNDRENNTLGLAVTNGHLHCVRMLVNKGAKVFKELLTYAIENNHRDIIKYFLTEHICIFKDYEAALFTAININDIKSVKLLISHGANVNAKHDAARITPLQLASMLGLRAIVEHLIDHGALVNVEASSDPLFLTVMYGHLDCLKVIIDKVRLDLHNYGSDIVHLAAREGHDYILDYLLSLKIDINQRNSYGFAPVHTAVTKHNLKCLKNLVHKGANVNLKTLIEDLTPLILAAGRGFQDIVEYLADNGAELDEEDSKYRQTALTLASGEGHLQCVQYLIAKGSDVQKYGPIALYNAALGDNPDIMDHLLSVGAHINGYIHGDMAPIHIATMLNKLEAVKLLLEKGASVNLRTLLYGFTPLMLAAGNGYQDIADCLIENEANVNEENKGRSALNLAASNGHLECVRILIDAGSNLTKYGPLAIRAATRSGHTAIVQLLNKYSSTVSSILVNK